MKNKKHSEAYVDYRDACKSYSTYLLHQMDTKSRITELWWLNTAESRRKIAELRGELKGRRHHIAQLSAEFKERKRLLRELSGVR